MLEIVRLGDELLRKKSEDVTEFGDDLRALVADMIETLDAVGGLGLSAVQVGILKRIFVVHIPDSKPMVFVNPEMIEMSEKVGPYEEGCLSVSGFYREIIRPLAVRIQARNVDGKLFNLKTGGLLARVIQHEYDHLNGVLFIDHLNSDERDLLVRAYERKNRPKKRKRK